MEKLKKALKTGICPFCKQKFEKTRKDKKYCSASCRVDACVKRKEKEKEEAIRAATIRELKNQNVLNVSKNFQEAAAPPQQKKEKKAIINNAAPPQEKDHPKQKYLNFDKNTAPKGVTFPKNAFVGGDPWPRRQQIKRQNIRQAPANNQLMKTRSWKVPTWAQWTLGGVVFVGVIWGLKKINEN